MKHILLIIIAFNMSACIETGDTIVESPTTTTTTEYTEYNDGGVIVKCENGIENCTTYYAEDNETE